MIVGRLLEVITGTAGREAIVAGMLAVVLFVSGAGKTPILGRDEARFSQAAREMLDRGDPVVPTFAGEGRYHKPILIYWCTMASYRVLGVNERAARMPSNLAGALVIALVAATARRRWGAGSGLLAGALLAATPVVWLQAKACTADMVLLLPTLAVMLAFERLLAGDESRGLAAVFWTAMGVAILAKGPIAPLWVVCTALALWAMGRRWRRWEIALAGVLLALGWWRLGPAVLLVPAAVATWDLLRSPDGRRTLARLRPAWGVPLLLAITLPWAVAVTAATDGAFLREAVGRHVVDRSFSAFESHGFFIGFYLVTAVVACFPWIGALAGVLPRQWRAVSGDREWRFLVAWLVGPLLLLELVQTKLVHYWMPSYPAGVLLVVAALWALPLDRRLGWSGRFLTAVGGFVVAAAVVALPFVIELPSLVTPGVVVAGVLALATAVGVVLQGRRPAAGTAAVACGTVIVLAGIGEFFLPVLGRSSLGPLAARAAVELARPDQEIVIFKPRDEEIYFYLPTEVRTCGDAACMAARFEAGTPMLGVARRDDFELLAEEWRGVRLTAIERVTGVDVGHARWDEQVLFRIRDVRPRGRPGGQRR